MLLRGARPPRPRRAGAARAALEADLHGLPERHGRAEPGDHGRRADRRHAAAPTARRLARGGPRARRRAARDGGHPRATASTPTRTSSRAACASGWASPSPWRSSPSLVILDEPTTALDVIVEREILEQIRELQRQLGFAVLFITHDLARMLQFSDRVAIFYAARLVEVAPAGGAAPRAAPPLHAGAAARLPLACTAAPWSWRASRARRPASQHPPAGCRFHPRCDRAVDLCRQRSPELRAARPAATPPPATWRSEPAEACRRRLAPAVRSPRGGRSGSPTRSRSSRERRVAHRRAGAVGGQRRAVARRVLVERAPGRPRTPSRVCGKPNQRGVPSVCDRSPMSCTGKVRLKSRW